MKFSEFAELSADELLLRKKEMKENYMKMRFQHATGQLDNPIKLRNARRDIARIHTVESQRRKSAGAGEGA